MQPFTTHSGLVLPLDKLNVDTDQMVPKQFLKLLTRKGYGRVLFYDWRYVAGEKLNPEFILNLPRYQGASILLARANFGCGSSREHAPWALLDYGFRVVIAPSFADIFHNNCLKNGLLTISLPEAQLDELFRKANSESGLRLNVDLRKQTISGDGIEYHFDVDPFHKQVLLEGLDDIGMTLKHEADIAAFEKSHPTKAVMYEPVDVKHFAAPN